MKGEGCKDGCFWTTVPSGTCAKAVCSCLSQHQHAVGCQVKPCGCACPSQLWKIPFSNFKLLKPLKFSRMFIYLAIKHYKELWIEDRVRSGHLKSVRAEATIKTVWERIRWNLLWKHIMSQKLNISTQSSRVSSGTIYTLGHTFTQKDTSLLLLWRKSDRQEQSVSSSGTPRTGTKTSSSRMTKFSPSRSSVTTSTRFMLKCSLRCILGVQGGHHPSYVKVWWEVSHQVVTHLHFCKKGVKLVSGCIKKMCYKEL